MRPGRRVRVRAAPAGRPRPAHHAHLPPAHPERAPPRPAPARRSSAATSTTPTPTCSARSSRRSRSAATRRTTPPAARAPRTLDRGRRAARPRPRPLRRRAACAPAACARAPTATPTCGSPAARRPTVRVLRKRAEEYGPRHAPAPSPPLPEHLRQARRAPVLEGPEGARRAGDRVRGRQGPAAARQARRARARSTSGVHFPDLQGGCHEGSRPRRARGGLNPGRADGRSGGRLQRPHRVLELPRQSGGERHGRHLHHQPRRQGPAPADQEPEADDAQSDWAPDGRDIAYRIRKPKFDDQLRGLAYDAPPARIRAAGSRSPRTARRPASRRGARTAAACCSAAAGPERREHVDDGARSARTRRVPLRPAGHAVLPQPLAGRGRRLLFATTTSATGDTDRAIETHRRRRQRPARRCSTSPGAYRLRARLVAGRRRGSRSSRNVERRAARNPERDMEIWVMDADGANPSQLTHNDRARRGAGVVARRHDARLLERRRQRPPRHQRHDRAAACTSAR